MKRTICFATVLFFLNTMTAQVHTSWAYRWGNADPASAPAITVNMHGDVFAAGSFRGTIDFDPGPGMSVFTSSFGGFGSDSYVTKFDSSGNFLWVLTWTATSFHTASEIICDADGNIYLAGYYAGTCDFDPGPDVFHLSGFGNRDELYVVKLDPEGDFIWAFTSTGDGNKYVNCLALDKDGDILLGGIFTGIADLDPGPGVVSFTAEGFFNDLFFAKYNPDGQLVWAKSSIGTFQGSVNGVSADSDGNVYFGGTFDDRRDFNPGPDSLILQATGPWDAYILKLSPVGDFIWVKHLGNDSDNWVHDLIVNEQNELLVCGHFGGILDFDPGPDMFELTATNSDPFVWKLNANGELLWVDPFPGISFDEARSIALDHEGNIYITGFFAETADFDPGPGQHLLTCTGNNDHDDVFVVKLDPDGRLAFAHQAGGLDNDAGRDIQTDHQGHIYFTGTFESTAGFFPDNLDADSLVSAGAGDVFLARWTQCLETGSEFNAVSCSAEYVSPSGQFTWTADGTYMDTVLNAAGCDSIITIHLHFVVIQTQVGQVPEIPNLLHAVEDNATYQWVDCQNGFTPLPGETGQDFTASVDGIYAVILTQEGCQDTSDCFALTTSLEKVFSGIQVALFPNPTQGNFTIGFQNEVQEAWISVFNAMGTLCYDCHSPATSQISTEPALAPGIYFVRIRVQMQEKFMKLVVR